MIQASLSVTEKTIIVWLRLCIWLVLTMVVIGGLTRLTESGLSIVEWKLLSGTLPPMTQEAWQQEFAHYQTTPEFIKENSHMTLADFKGIFWLEYIHRLLGRVIGLAYLLPLIWLSARRKLPPRLVSQLWGVFALVCTQGVVGWYMVKSGLIHDPHVSPYRLAFHLCLATLILSRTYWLLHFHASSSTVSAPPSRRAGWAVLALIMTQVFFGALVAGLHAGMIYNTFPLMGGQFLPPESWVDSPWIRNLFEHAATVQFIHRWLAFTVLAVLLWQWLRRREEAALVVVCLALLQVMLGIATLLSVVAIPLASLHQFTAILLVLLQVRYLRKSASHFRKSGHKGNGVKAA